MRKLLGHLAFCAGLGVLIAATGTPVARGATIYEITVTITDLTTPGNSTSFVVPDGPLPDTNPDPNAITAQGAFLGTASSTSGVTFTALNSDTLSTSLSTQLNAGGSFTLNSGVTDHYLITILTTHDTYTLPPAAGTARLTQSESGTYTFTGAGNTQTSQSWYSPTNTANSTVPPGTPPVVIPIPATAGSNASGSSPTVGTTVSPYVIPYALTNRIIIDVTGTGAANNSVIGFHSSTTLASVPEPASVVMFLTGMPLPLVVVGLLRRRRRVAA
jgi:hypothetical protein